MPALSEVMEYAQLFTVNPLEVDEDRCVAVRNRNATCRKCQDVCQTDAITIENNEVSIDGGACVNCGACVGVCPTSCIAAVQPEAQKVVSNAVRVAAEAQGIACIACARKAAQHDADPDLFCEVPCLAHLDEHGLAAMARAGARDIVLVDGTCDTCKYGAVNPCIDEAVVVASDLFDAVQAPVVVTRSHEFPPELAGTFTRDVRGSDRRGLMFQTGRYLKTVAGNVAQKTLEDKMGASGHEPRSLKERLGAGKSGKLPQFTADANRQLIDDLLAVGDAQVIERAVAAFEDGEGESATHSPSSSPEPLEPPLDMRRFGTLEIHPTECSGCGLCVLFCPTAALTYARYDEPTDPEMRYLEFQAADCTQCNMCRDVCLRKCLEVKPRTTAGEVFSFEPRLIEIPRPKERLNLFNRL